MLDVGVELFAKGDMSVMYFEQQMLDHLLQMYLADQYVSTDVRHVHKNVQRIYRLCEARIKGFFGTISKIRSPEQLKRLPHVFIMLAGVMPKTETVTDYAAHIENSLEKSCKSRYQDYMDQANLKQIASPEALMKLLDLVTAEIVDVVKSYNFTLLECVLSKFSFDTLGQSTSLTFAAISIFARWSSFYPNFTRSTKKAIC